MIMIKISKKDNSPFPDRPYHYDYTFKNGGGSGLNSRESCDEYLKPEALNKLIRQEVRSNNLDFYPKIEIDDCGKKWIYQIPMEETWEGIKILQEYKIGEIVLYKWCCDEGDWREAIIWSYKHNEYYIEYLKTEDEAKGYEYLGYREHRLADINELKRLKGEVITKRKFDHAQLEDKDWSEEDYSKKYGEKEWNFAEIKSMEMIKEEKCYQLVKVEFENDTIFIRGYEAELVSRIIGIEIKPIKVKNGQANLFAY